MQNIILFGVKHCGKSTLGKLLACNNNILFYDLDDEILKICENELTIREIYKKVGLEKFKELEVIAIKKIFSENFDKQIVLSLGGGTIENQEAINLFRNNALLIYIDGLPEILYSRIIETGIPPFLSQENPWEDFLKLYEKRKALCLELSDFSITPINGDVDKSVEILNFKIKEYTNGR